MVDARDEAKRVAHGERFHAAVMDKGLVFAAILYVLITVFALGTVGSIVEAVMGGSLMAALPGILLGGLVLYFAHRENLYGVVATLVVPYLLLGLFLVFTTATMLSTYLGTLTSPTLMMAVVTAVPLLLLGAVTAYLFNAVSTDRRGLGGAALTGSAIIAVGAGMARIIQAAIRQITESQTVNGGAGGIGTPVQFLNTNAAPNPDLLFLTVLAAFNIPFLYYARRRFVLDRDDLVWYLIPITIYVIIGVGGSTVLF